MIPIVESNEQELLKIINRPSFITDEKINNQVKDIIENVRERKDKALFEYTSKFDGANISELRVKPEAIIAAYEACDPELYASLEKAAANIRLFHEKQITNSFFDYKQDEIILGQLVNPIENIGLYIPGGSAAYPSTILMNVIPAQLAGCKRIVLVSPPNKNNQIDQTILATAYLCGIDEIYQVGGAQAIAALTYGTESIKKVDKICGPGNSYVALAKKMLNGEVGIDMIAGPSEVLVIADENAPISYIAADLLAQAEHDCNASSILLSPSIELAKEVNNEIIKQLDKLTRKEIIIEALREHSFIVVVDSIDEACTIANRIAPEHLELMVENPFDLLSKIKNAGSIFLGPYAPEALGDYFAGPNHTLPTNGTARFSSALSVDDFIKKSSIIYYSKKALDKVNTDIVTIANAEGLDAHANAIKVRSNNE